MTIALIIGMIIGAFCGFLSGLYIGKNTGFHRGFSYAHDLVKAGRSLEAAARRVFGSNGRPK